MVSGLGTAGISRREETGSLSFNADGVVDVVAGAAGSAIAGVCPNDRCSAGFAFLAGFSLTDVPSSRTERFVCDW